MRVGLASPTGPIASYVHRGGRWARFVAWLLPTGTGPFYYTADADGVYRDEQGRPEPPL